MTTRDLALLGALAVLTAACGGRTVVVEDDAGDREPATVDVVGTWHDCASSIIYGPDGSTTAINHLEGGCTARGTYTVVGDVVTTSWSEPGCGFGPETRGRRVVRGEDGITTVDRTSGRVNQRADGSRFEHHLYRLVGVDGGATLTSILSVVGDPSQEFGSGCYWSEDGECGGLFSCTGSVVQWRFEAERLNASMACMGGCPCGSVVGGDVDADGTIRGDFRGVNCDRTYEGTFVATPL